MLAKTVTKYLLNRREQDVNKVSILCVDSRYLIRLREFFLLLQHHR